MSTHQLAPPTHTPFFFFFPPGITHASLAPWPGLLGVPRRTPVTTLRTAPSFRREAPSAATRRGLPEDAWPRPGQYGGGDTRNLQRRLLRSQASRPPQREKQHKTARGGKHRPRRRRLRAPGRQRACAPRVPSPRTSTGEHPPPPCTAQARRRPPPPARAAERAPRMRPSAPSPPPPTPRRLRAGALSPPTRPPGPPGACASLFPPPPLPSRPPSGAGRGMRTGEDGGLEQPAEIQREDRSAQPKTGGRDGGLRRGHEGSEPNPRPPGEETTTLPPPLPPPAQPPARARAPPPLPARAPYSPSARARARPRRRREGGGW